MEKDQMKSHVSEFSPEMVKNAPTQMLYHEDEWWDLLVW